MDAQRSRRTKDQARKAWYAYHRQVRFARWLGFITEDAAMNHGLRRSTIPNQSLASSRLP